MKFNVYSQDYAIAGFIKPSAGCNAVLCVNRGDDVAWINGMRLEPSPLGVGYAGDSFSWAGNLGEVFTGNLELRFLGVGVNPVVSISQKFYL